VTDENRHLQEDVDALLVRSAQNRRRLTQITRELNDFWRRVLSTAPRKRK
jgi:hypothetical protein